MDHVVLHLRRIIHFELLQHRSQRGDSPADTDPALDIPHGLHEIRLTEKREAMLLQLTAASGRGGIELLRAAHAPEAEAVARSDIGAESHADLCRAAADIDDGRDDTGRPGRADVAIVRFLLPRKNADRHAEGCRHFISEFLPIRRIAHDGRTIGEDILRPFELGHGGKFPHSRERPFLCPLTDGRLIRHAFPQPGAAKFFPEDLPLPLFILLCHQKTDRIRSDINDRAHKSLLVLPIRYILFIRKA